MKSTIRRILREETNDYYDRILDLYNEVGYEGMTPDEIEYFKTGGKSKLPKKYASEISQQRYDDYVTGFGTNDEIISSEWEDIYDLQKIINAQPTKVRYINNYDGFGFFLDSLCSLVFEADWFLDSQEKDSKLLPSLRSLNHQFNLEIRKKKGWKENHDVLFAIPKKYLPYLENIEKVIVL